MLSKNEIFCVIQTTVHEKNTTMAEIIKNDKIVIRQERRTRTPTLRHGRAATASRSWSSLVLYSCCCDESVSYCYHVTYVRNTLSNSLKTCYLRRLRHACETPINQDCLVQFDSFHFILSFINVDHLNTSQACDTVQYQTIKYDYSHIRWWKDIWNGETKYIINNQKYLIPCSKVNNNTRVRCTS